MIGEQLKLPFYDPIQKYTEEELVKFADEFEGLTPIEYCNKWLEENRLTK